MTMSRERERDRERDREGQRERQRQTEKERDGLADSERLIEMDREEGRRTRTIRIDTVYLLFFVVLNDALFVL